MTIYITKALGDTKESIGIIGVVSSDLLRRAEDFLNAVVLNGDLTHCPNEHWFREAKALKAAIDAARAEGSA